MKKIREIKLRRTVISLISITALLMALSSLDNDSNRITGLTISPFLGKTTIFPFLFFIIAATLVLMVFYEKEIYRGMHHLESVNKPMKISSKSKLRNQFRSKIHDWLSKHGHSQ